MCACCLEYSQLMKSGSVQWKMNEFDDVEGVRINVDDLCAWRESDEDYDRRIEHRFDRIGYNGVKLNRPKCMFCVDNVGYVCHVLSKDGLKPSSDRIQGNTGYANSSEQGRVEHISRNDDIPL